MPRQTTKTIEDLLDDVYDIGQEIEEINQKQKAEEEKITKPVQVKLQACRDKFDRQKDKLGKELRKATDDAKKAVVKLGETVTTDNLQAVYVKGRVSWDDSFLRGLAATNPKILEGRKEGEPSVSLRPVKK